MEFDFKEMSFGANRYSTQDINLMDDSLIPQSDRQAWIFLATSRLQHATASAQFRNQRALFTIVSSLTAQATKRREMLANSEKVIELSAELLNERELREQLDFEKEELIASLAQKSEELEKVMTMASEYKIWKDKIGAIENNLKTELDHWKATCDELMHDKEKLESELFEKEEEKANMDSQVAAAMKQLTALQGQNEKLAASVRKMELTKGLASVEEKVCESCDDTAQLKSQLATLEAANETLVQEMTDFKAKVQTQVEDMVKLEEEKILLIKENERLRKKSTTRTRAPPSAAMSKRRLELEKPANNADQLAHEIIRLNKEVNKLKYEVKTANDATKKAEIERSSLQKQLGTKSEALENLRRENEGLYLSVNQDHFKSVQKIESTACNLGIQNKSLRDKLLATVEEREDIVQKLTLKKAKIHDLKLRIQELESTPSVEAGHSNAESVADLTNQLQAATDQLNIHKSAIENMQSENERLAGEIDFLTATARSNKLHADKASNDAKTYYDLLLSTESRLNEVVLEKRQVDMEIADLRGRVSNIN